MRKVYCIVCDWVYAYRRPWQTSIVIGNAARYFGYISFYHFPFMDPVLKRKSKFIRFKFHLRPKPVIDKRDQWRLKLMRKFQCKNEGC